MGDCRRRCSSRVHRVAQVKFVKLPELNDAARVGLRDALGTDREAAALAEQVKNGVAELWAIDHGSGELSFMITRTNPPELVVCAYQGRALAEVVPHLIEAGRRQGCDTIRFHTMRRGLERLLKSFEPKLSEFVYRIPIC